MDAIARVEHELSAAIARACADPAPPRLAEALSYAVFPGGARVRPLLCLAVAKACDARTLDVAAGFGAAVELMHCASLAHDDLPCFDDADERRGKPALHRRYGEALAVLAGDALIIAAFEALSAAGAHAPGRLVDLMRILIGASGMPAGICAGQAWESEPAAPLSAYQQAKTGSLFVAATTGGAAAAGADPAPWRALGARIGEAYQVADDLLDAMADPGECDKPVCRDDALGRPSAVGALGVEGALARLDELVALAMDSVPECDGAEALRELVALQARRLVPKGLARSAA